MIRSLFWGLVSFFCVLESTAQSTESQTISLPEFLDSYSKSSGIQFAYDPTVFREIYLDYPLKNIENHNDLAMLLESLELDYLLVDDKRWMLKQSIQKPEESKIIQLSGKVSDYNDEALVNALLFSSDMQYSVLTDIQGNFSIDIPVGQDIEICCQYLGYEISCVNVAELFDDNLSFQLKPKAFNLEAVELTAKRLKFNINPLSDSEKVIVSESGWNQNILGNDLLRTVQLLSGVDATNDRDASLRIRSSSDLQSLITLDGIPIYNPESAFGIFSSLNPLVIKESTLYKNALPLDYGEFTGAYLECKGEENILDKTHFDLNVNTLSTSASINIPIKEKFQINAAFRGSNGSISNRQFYSRIAGRRDDSPRLIQQFSRPELLDTELENSFGDVYLNLNYKPHDRARLYLSLFANRDFSGSSYEDLNLFNHPDLEQPINVKENFENNRVKRNRGLSLSYQSKFENNAVLTTRFFTSTYTLSDSVLTRVRFFNPNFSNNNVFRSLLEQGVADSGIKFDFQTDPQKDWSFKTGLDYKRLINSLKYKSQEVRNVDFSVAVPSLVPYIGIQYQKNSQYYINAGTRLSIIPIAELPVFWSPRIQAAYKIFEGIYLKTSLSHSEQFFRPIEIEQQLGQSIELNVLTNNKNIPILVSNQLTLGLNYSGENFMINSDFYFRTNEGILEQVLVQPGINDNQNNIFGNNKTELIQGDNRVFGFDFTGSYENGNFNSLVSYTFSNSEDKFEALFEDTYLPAQNNRLHQWNILASYQWKNWNFSSTYIYGSGIYTLNRGVIEENIIRKNVDPGNLYKQLPAYNRFDLNVSYKIDFEKSDLYFDFSIFNLFNNKNISSEIYIYRLQQANVNALGAAEINLLSRIVSLGLRLSI